MSSHPSYVIIGTFCLVVLFFAVGAIVQMVKLWFDESDAE